MATMAANAPPTSTHLTPLIASGQPVFIDTNVLIFSTVPTAPWHVEAKETLDGLNYAKIELWNSRQILREYLSAMTRPQSYAPATPLHQVMLNVQRFLIDFHIAEDGPTVTTELLTLLGT